MGWSWCRSIGERFSGVFRRRGPFSRASRVAGELFVGPGDAFLLRWGHWARQDDIGPFDTGAEATGLDNSVIPWLRERDLSIIG